MVMVAAIKMQYKFSRFIVFEIEIRFDAEFGSFSDFSRHNAQHRSDITVISRHIPSVCQ
jgi:hypothetical protein